MFKFSIHVLDPWDGDRWVVHDEYRAYVKQVYVGPNYCPIDLLADHAIIGAAKIAKGTIKFAQWSSEMVAEFGDKIKPHLKELYEQSKNIVTQYKKTAAKQIAAVICNLPKFPASLSFCAGSYMTPQPG